MPSPHRTRSAGQASADYVALIALVAVVLAGAGAAVAGTPALGGLVMKQLRTALCIVGGDVCRTSDARAAGLDPCVTVADSHERHEGLTVGFVRTGEDSAYSVERRSDDTFVLTALFGRSLRGRAAAGLKLGPYVDVHVGTGAGVRWRSGGAWELPDEAALKRFLTRFPAPSGLADAATAEALGAPAPTERYREGGSLLDASAGATIFGAELPLADGEGALALGRRIRGAETTYFLDASTVGPRLFGGKVPGLAGPGERSWVVELATRAGRATRLTLRALRPEADGDQLVEHLAHLPLDDPQNRRAARDLIGLRSGWDPLAAARAAAVGRRLLSAGTVERRVYRMQDLDSDPDIALDVGVAGFDHQSSARRRVLVAAEVYGADGTVAQRRDCLASARAGV